MSNDTEVTASGSPASRWAAVVVLLAGGAIAWWVLGSGPVVAPEEDSRKARGVRVMALKPTTSRVSVRAYGTVIPSRRVTIEPQVTGRIIRMHPALAPGGRIERGEELFVIDPTLMEFTLRESKAQVVRAQAMLKESRRKLSAAAGLDRKVIPETERAALASDVEIKEAEVRRLEAGVTRTEELLRRHRVKAPFNALVIEESVDVGQRVDPGFAAATLVGTDEFWVRASLPIDQLQWIRLPEGETRGATADVYLETGSGRPEHRTGSIVRLLGDIHPTGRMARVLARVDHPLDCGDPNLNAPLLLGSYVRVEIDAGELKDVFAINRSTLREGDRVWIANENDELEIRDVRVRWRDRETVYLDEGVKPGDRLIVSPLRVALPGMKLNPQAVKP